MVVFLPPGPLPTVPLPSLTGKSRILFADFRDVWERFVNFLPFRRSVLSTTASSETLDVCQEGKEVLVFITGVADVTISGLHRTFQAPYCKTGIGLDRIALDWTQFVTYGFNFCKELNSEQTSGAN